MENLDWSLDSGLCTWKLDKDSGQYMHYAVYNGHFTMLLLQNVYPVVILMYPLLY